MHYFSEIIAYIEIWLLVLFVLSHCHIKFLSGDFAFVFDKLLSKVVMKMKPSELNVGKSFCKCCYWNMLCNRHVSCCFLYTVMLIAKTKATSICWLFILFYLSIVYCVLYWINYYLTQKRETEREKEGKKATLNHLVSFYWNSDITTANPSK